MNSPGDRDRVADVATIGRSAQVVASALVAARFLPIWLATGALLVIAALFAPSALENTSWSYVLPYMTILAIAALGQMLVVMQAGIDLSTAGVISLSGNVLVGVSELPNRCGAAVRVLGPTSGTVKSTLSKAWSAARLALLGTPAPNLRKG